MVYITQIFYRPFDIGLIVVFEVQFTESNFTIISKCSISVCQTVELCLQCVHECFIVSVGLKLFSAKDISVN